MLFMKENLNKLKLKEAVSMEVNAAFGLTGDSSRGRAGYLPELIEDGVRLLVYAGDADMILVDWTSLSPTREDNLEFSSLESASPLFLSTSSPTTEEIDGEYS